MQRPVIAPADPIDAEARTLEAALARGDDPARVAQSAEALGRSALAVRAWQVALQRRADDVVAWEALARLHDERGEPDRADRCREELQRLGRRPPPRPLAEAVVASGPDEADRIRFADRFRGREDTHARMWHDPAKGTGYQPVRRPMDPDVVRAHLAGEITIGTYLLRLDGTCDLWVLDLDATRAALEGAQGDAARTRDLRRLLHEEGLRLLGELRGLGLDPLLEDSGYKGRHLWGFLPSPLPGPVVHEAVKRLRDALRSPNPLVSLEAFPKQGSAGEGGLGNLVKLPLGVHLRSGRRSTLLDDDGRALDDPWRRLREVRPAPLPTIELPPAALPVAPAGPPPATGVPVPAFTEGDLDASPALAAVLGGCAVLGALVQRTLADRSISRDATVALQHSLGHLPDGVAAVNWVFDHVPGVPAEERLKSVLRGSPVSCAKIRQRLPRLAGEVGCACVFPEVPGSYPHPLRHLDGINVTARAPTRTVHDLLAAYGRQLARLREVEAEAAALRRAAVEALRGVPGQQWVVDGGVWRLDDDGGLAVLRWEEGAAGGG